MVARAFGDKSVGLGSKDLEGIDGKGFIMSDGEFKRFERILEAINQCADENDKIKPHIDYQCDCPLNDECNSFYISLDKHLDKLKWGGLE